MYITLLYKPDIFSLLTCKTPSKLAESLNFFKAKKLTKNFSTQIEYLKIKLYFLCFNTHPRKWEMNFN